MDLFQRWIFLAVMLFINVELFNTADWQFWAIAGGIGIICSPLFNQKRK